MDIKYINDFKWIPLCDCTSNWKALITYDMWTTVSSSSSSSSILIKYKSYNGKIKLNLEISFGKVLN